MKSRIAKACIAGMTVLCPLGAFFASVVHDPISYANALVMLHELKMSYDQLKAQLEFQVWMSTVVPVNMSLRYRLEPSVWHPLAVAHNRFGNLSAWLEAANAGVGASTAYASASVELGAFGSGLSQLAVDEQRKAASRYASAELTDATNINTLQAIGAMRAGAEAAERSIGDLTADALSAEPGMNTAIAVLNKLNATAVASLRASRDTNRALLSVLEQQLIESKRRRDAQVAELNDQIARTEFGASAKAEYTNSITQSLRSFRWK